MNYRLCLERIQHTNVRVCAEHLVVVVLTVYQLQFEELQLLPSSFQLLLSLFKQLLQFLDQTQVLLLARTIVKQLFQLVVLFLH